MTCGQAGNGRRQDCQAAVLGARPGREGGRCFRIPDPLQAGAVAHALQGLAARQETDTGLIPNTISCCRMWCANECRDRPGEDCRVPHSRHLESWYKTESADCC